MKKPAQTEIVATLRDEVSAKAAEIDRNLRRTAENASRLGGIAGNPMLGRVGGLMNVARTAGPAGLAVGGAFLLDRSLAMAAPRMDDFAKRLAEANDPVREFGRSLARSVPVLSSAVEFGRSLGNIFASIGEQAGRERIGRDADARRADAATQGMAATSAAGGLDAFLRKRATESEQLTALIAEARQAQKLDSLTDFQRADLARAMANATARLAEAQREAASRRNEAQAGTALSEMERTDALRAGAAIDAMRRAGDELGATLAQADERFRQAVRQLAAVDIDDTTENGRRALEQQRESLRVLEEIRDIEKEQARINADNLLNDQFMQSETERMQFGQALSDMQRDAAERAAERVASMMAGYRGETLQEGFGNFALRGDIAAVQAQGMQMQAEIEANQQRRRQTEIQQKIDRNIEALLRLLQPNAAI
jgi:hypothetical protein